MNDVRKYYNNHTEEEDRRLDEHPFEIPVTMHFVSKYLNPGDHLFDVACGTGRISAVLLNMGFYKFTHESENYIVEIYPIVCRNIHTLFK